MRIALVLSFGFLVGGIVGAFAVGTARGGDSPGEWIRVQIENVGTVPLTVRWPDYGSSKPPAETMADRFTIEPGVYAYFPRARSGDRIDVQVRAVSGAEPRPVDAKELAAVKSRLVGWEKNAVVQRSANSCVATGFEYLLRSAGIQGIDYATFQDEFDLGVALNSYPTVARAIERRYPNVRFAWSDFKRSEESMQFIERSIDEGRPIVLGLPGSPTSTHIVPVLGYDEKWVYYLNYAHADGTKDVRAIRRWELARRDQEWVTGTCATAWLVTWWPPAADTKEAVKPDAANPDRRADPAAEELFRRYVDLVHYPATEGWKTVTGKGDAEHTGTMWAVNPTWTLETDFDVDFTLPQSVKGQLPRGTSEEWIVGANRDLLKSRLANVPFDLPAGWAKSREHFHVTLRQDGEDQVVEMTPFDDKADAKSRRYVFGKDGLLKNSSIELKPSPSWPEGTRGDLDWRFEKRGERYVIASIKLTYPALGEEFETKFTYFDGPNGSTLPKTITMSDRHLGEQVIRFHDWVVDGRPVDATKASLNREEETREKPAETPPVPKAEK